jgi:UMF1 family MFS transporter
MDKRTIRAWCLYDFGNSAFAVLFPAVFGAYFVHRDGLAGSTAAWGVAVSLSMFAVAVSSPFLGGVADHAKVRKRMLAIYTSIGIAAVLCIPLLTSDTIVVAVVVIVLGNFAFEGGIIFYNSYLPAIAPKEQHGRISAWGYAIGYLGSLVAIIYAAFVQIDWVWVLLAAQWIIAATPGFIRLPPDGGEPRMEVVQAARHGLRTTNQTIRDVWGMKNLRGFLVAYFFYMDGVLTVIHFATIYATDHLGFTITESMGMLALVQVTALAGSLIMARPTDRRGPKWTVSIVLLWWIGVAVAAFFCRSKLSFTVVAGLAGLGLGSIQAASRAFMSRLIPPGREAEMFGFYGLCGKSGAIMGPLLFGVIAKTVSYPAAILSVCVLYIVGWTLLRPVRDTA